MIWVTSRDDGLRQHRRERPLAGLGDQLDRGGKIGTGDIILLHRLAGQAVAFLEALDEGLLCRLFDRIDRFGRGAGMRSLAGMGDIPGAAALLVGIECAEARAAAADAAKGTPAADRRCGIDMVARPRA